eukprot:2601300-Rhodomonas_salina.2
MSYREKHVRAHQLLSCCTCPPPSAARRSSAAAPTPSPRRRAGQRGCRAGVRASEPGAGYCFAPAPARSNESE